MSIDSSMRLATQLINGVTAPAKTERERAPGEFVPLPCLRGS